MVVVVLLLRLLLLLVVCVCVSVCVGIIHSLIHYWAFIEWWQLFFMVRTQWCIRHTNLGFSKLKDSLKSNGRDTPLPWNKNNYFKYNKCYFHMLPLSNVSKLSISVSSYPVFSPVTVYQWPMLLLVLSLQVGHWISLPIQDLLSSNLPLSSSPFDYSH